MFSNFQKTIRSEITFKGIGLHTGKNVNLKLIPSNQDTGIVFKRTDIDNSKNIVFANYTNVISAKFCTKLQNEFGVSVSTVEHLLGALYGEGIDNLLIEVDGPEVPILDGSAIKFLNGIRSVGIQKQAAIRKIINVERKIEIKSGSKYISIEPKKKNLEIDFELIYANDLIGKQRENVNFQKDDLSQIYNSRTFCLFEDIEQIKKIGLAKGGSLDNAIVVKNDKIINEDGLRHKNEFVKHKILDCMGDIMLAGNRLYGLIKCSQGGHQLTNELLRKFFANKENWTIISSEKEKNNTNKSFFPKSVAVNA